MIEATSTGTITAPTATLPWARLAWTALAAAGLTLPGTAILQSPHSWAFWGQGLFVLSWTAVGGFLVWRAPPSRIAVCAAVFLVAFPVMFIDDPVLRGLPELDAAVGVLGLLSFLLFGYLFPDGRFAPRWTRWMWWAWTLFFVLDRLVVGGGGETAGALAVAENIAWIGSTSSVVAVQIHRYRHAAGGLEREQTKWIVYGVAVSVVGSLAVVLLADVGALGPAVQSERIVTAVSYGVVSVLPLCLAVAVLRYRLWDVDLLINRTLVYVLLSAAALSAYVVAVLAASALVDGAGWLPLSALTVGLLAAALHPLHMWVQRTVNRLMYGRRDDPYTVLAGLGQRLQSVASAEAVLPVIVETATDALRLPYVAIELLEPDGEERIVAASGLPGRSTARWPLEHQRELIGHLVAAPRRGESLGGADARLLSDLASQAGAAVHAVLLGRALHRAGAQLVIAREEERRRLHRDLHDELGATLSALTIKAGVARALIPTDPAAAADTAHEIEEGLAAAVSEVRRLVYALRPPVLDERGLPAALADHLGRPSSGAGIPVDVVVCPPGTWPPLPAAVELAAYRIAQEALTNVRRHARAAHCRLDLRLLDDGTVPYAVELSVTDDGVGFGPGSRSGVGLRSMRDRARELGGSCSIDCIAGGGVRVAAVLPVGGGERT
jgi:signal transduction histidine kinase